MRRRGPIRVIALLSIWLLSACTPPISTPTPDEVVHFRNMSGSALLVGVTSGDVQSQAVLRSCGGETSFAVWPPPVDDPRILMSAGYDSTGAFDRLVAQQPAGSIDPDTIGHWQLTGIIWSRGDIGIDDLPKWITFQSGTTDVGDSAPTDIAPARCDPWPPSE